MSIPLIERSDLVGNHAEEKTGQISYYPLRADELHALAAKALEPVPFKPPKIQR